MPTKTARIRTKKTDAPYNADEIAEFLNDLKAQAVSKAAQGRSFERFIQKLFKEHPGEYGSQMFEDVWRWNEEWPRKDEQLHQMDVGVDLVGQLRGSGELCAIQCKFFSDTSALAKADIDGFITASPPHLFAKRILVTTVEPGGTCQKVLREWGVHVITHFDIASWGVNFENYKIDPDASLYSHTKYEPRDYQEKAIRDVAEGFNKQEGPDRRGQMIMPCGVGKSVVALWIAEHEDVVPSKGHVLYLVPSIALMGQTMREWARQRRRDHQFLGVCSDSKIARTAEDADLTELAMPVTTDPKAIAEFLTYSERERERENGFDLTVVFSTYQSLEAIAQAQKKGAPDFDLVICDEAHRTTGVEGSEFTQIHDAKKLKAERRLYMTATSRIYTQTAKKKAKEKAASLGLFSMDDEATFGPRLHQMSFKDAIDGGHLSPYEVIVLMHDGHYNAVQSYKATFSGDDSKKIDGDDCAKILGCWDALADPSTDGLDPDRDTGQIDQSTKFSLRRSIAFCNKIKTSELATKYLNELVDARIAEADNPDQLLDCEADHIDGKMNAFERSKKIEWLRNLDSDKAHVLTNARCLTEGVDVPALDAVLFLDPKQSEIDVVQAVGRVMRKAPGKEKGYIVLPVLMQPGQKPEKVIGSSEFKKVWSVLRALRAHDESFNALINTPNLPFEKLPIKIFSSRSSDLDTDEESDEGAASESTSAAERAVQAQLPLLQVHSKLMEGIFDKVADKQYWPRWAAEMAGHIETIKRQIDKEIQDYSEVREKHKEFLTSMQETINGEVSEEDLTEMLAQHVVTLPVFEALFRGNNFANSNPIARAMNSMLDALDAAGNTKLREEQKERLKSFYKSVEIILEGIDERDSESRLAVLLELYDTFFKIAMPKQVAQLGVAYTPVPVVDFVLRAANDACQAEFGLRLSDKDVHIIDPFAGTGTFLNRLLTTKEDPSDEKSEYLVRDKDIQRKYLNELHTNEIMLLAYYIATVKIEEGYKERNSTTKSVPFEGIVLTDTFELTDNLKQINPKLKRSSTLRDNSNRIQRQSDQIMRVVIGNPPWFAGAKDAGLGITRPKNVELEQRIRDTYAASSRVVQKKWLYNSYIKALRWATDRINPTIGGIVCFVLPNSIIDGKTESAVRACFSEEFTSVYVLNLRGAVGKNAEQNGGEPIFKNTQGTCVILLIQNPALQGKPFRLRYFEVGDNLRRSQKFNKLIDIKSPHKDIKNWRSIIPSDTHDWINQDNPEFFGLPELTNSESKSHALKLLKGKKDPTYKSEVFAYLFSNGVITLKDDWLYSFGRKSLISRIRKMLTYREEVRQTIITGNYKTHSERVNAAKELIKNSSESTFKWCQHDRSYLEKDIAPGKEDSGRIQYSKKFLTEVHYRPFVKSHLYCHKKLLWSWYRIPYMFPQTTSQNQAITFLGTGQGIGEFSSLATDSVPDLNLHRGGGASNRKIHLRGSTQQFASPETARAHHSQCSRQTLRRIWNLCFMGKQSRGTSTRKHNDSRQRQRCIAWDRNN